MATARVATTILRLLPVFVYSSGDPGGRHALYAVAIFWLWSPYSGCGRHILAAVAMFWLRSPCSGCGCLALHHRHHSQASCLPRSLLAFSRVMFYNNISY